MKTIKMIACFVLIAGLSSCKNDPEAWERKEMRSADSAAVLLHNPDDEKDLQEEERKLVQTASIALNVTEVKSSSQKIIELTRSVGGRVMNHQYTLNKTESVQIRKSSDSLQVINACKPEVTLNVRVPSDSLENFLITIQQENNGVVEMKYSAFDKSFYYKENNLRNNLRQRYLSRGASPKALSDSQAITEAEVAVANIIANDKINSEVAYSAVDLKLGQSPILTKEIVANTDLSVFQLPFSTRLSDALSTGFDSLTALFMGLAQFWWLTVIGALCWIAFRQFKVQKSSRLAVITSADDKK